ncbi:hypothetical protein HN51_054239, partial [Arachis hypogaea]
SSQSLANRRSRAEAAAHSHSQSQEPTAPNPMGVPLKNGVEAAPDSEDEALTIPSQQWHTGEPNPFDSRYGGSKLDLVVPAACMIRIEMGCRCCLLRKLWGPSSPIQRLREMPSDGSGSRLYLVDEIPSVYVSDYRSSVQCGGTSVGSTPRRWKNFLVTSIGSVASVLLHCLKVQVWFFLFCFVKQTTGFVFRLVEGKDTVCCVGWNPCLSSMLIRFRGLVKDLLQFITEW